MVYISLFTISFLAATILPISSELTLAGLINTKDHNAIVLLSSASLGNILGSVFNWVIGFYLFKHIDKKWLPFSQTQIDKASLKFKKFGAWSLLFTWVPIIGDPLTFVAGLLKFRFSIFLCLVSLGKISRYFFVYSLMN